MKKAPDENHRSLRIDLRLVAPALAAWAGTLAGLSDNQTVILTVGGCGILMVLVALRLRRAAGGIAAVAALLAGGAVAGMHWHAAATDPLVRAGSTGSWSDLALVIDRVPQPVTARFTTGDDQAAAGTKPLRWRIGATARRALVAGHQWRPVAAVTIFAQGPAWSSLVVGSQISASGLLATDTMSVVPAVVLQARGPPLMVAAAPWWQRAAAEIRDELVGNASGLGADARGLLPGLVVGDISGISDSLTADAKTTGLTHLLAVSGSHFAILCGAVVLALRRFGPRVAAVAGAVMLVGLVVLVGPQAAVLRAAVMGGITLAALVLGRSRSALPALATAVMVLLFTDPALARSAGFALSVQATAGLVLVAPAWSKALQRRGFPPGWADLLATPAAAGVATMPVVAALSGSVSLAGIPANLLAAPVVPAALVIGVLCAIAGPWWPAGAHALAIADEPLLSWIAWVAHRMARWPSATVPWPASVPGVLMLSGLLVGGLMAMRHRRIRALVVAVGTGLVLILIPAQVISVGWPPSGWLVTACEVGEGDGMVLSTGEPGAGVVVDAGPDPDLMDRCLDRLSVTTVPLVILTHLHADHVDGLAGVLPGRRVGAIGVGPDRSSSTAWRTINSLATGRGIPVVALPAGTHWSTGKLNVEILGPTKTFHGTDSDPNNDSVVIRATISGVRILMTGDIGIEAQQEMLNVGTDLRADIMEQPHHGSAKVLSSFVAAVAPRVTLIGVGLGNDYGHPTPKALAQLSVARVTVLRTDLQGDASVCLVDGKLATTVRGAVLRSAKAAGSSQ